MSVGPRESGSRAARALAAVCCAVLASLVAACAPGAVTDGGERRASAVPRPLVLRVSAATSLKDVLEKTVPEFERASGATVVLNFAASGVLQKQIEGGAPADVFVSADPKQVEALTAGGFIAADTTSTFAGNDIVVFVPAGNPAGIIGPDDLGDADRIVTGNPDTAPHGAKAKEWLEAIGAWPSLEPGMVFAENAAQTLDYVARGEVDAGIGFASETRSTDAVEVVYTVPVGAIVPVRYVSAPLRASEHPDEAAAYVAFLASPIVRTALTEAGFLPAPAK